MFSVIGSLASAIIFVLGAVGLPGLLALMIVESFGFPPLPSELILPFAGYLVAEGMFPFYAAMVVAVLGGLIGAYAAYAVGRWWRHRLEHLRIGALRLEPRHLERMERFFARRGEVTVTVARLIPVVRSYISYPAGTAAMSPVRFGVYTAVGLTPFAAAFLYAGLVLRSHWTQVEASFRWIDYAGLVVVVIGGIYLYLVLTERLSPGWPPRRNTPQSPG